MPLGNQIPDNSIQKALDQKLARRGGGAVRVKSAVRGGNVTLTGTIGYEHERRPLIRVASSVPGVRRVIDQVQVAKKHSSRE
jgi:osmotically-inducible protein OsmY